MTLVLLIVFDVPDGVVVKVSSDAVNSPVFVELLIVSFVFVRVFVIVPSIIDIVVGVTVPVFIPSVINI